MVEGLRFNFKGSFIKQYLLDRAKDHEEAASLLMEKMAAAEKLDARNGFGYRPSDYEALSKQQQKRVYFYQCLAEHVNEGEIYQVSVFDFLTLEAQGMFGSGPQPPIGL